MGEPLASPPLIEALCEFFFKPPTAWDWTLPGILYTQIRDEFPVKTQLDSFTVPIRVTRDLSLAEPASRAPDRVQFRRPDGSAVVQVGPNLLVVNHLRPYPEWERFRDLIVQMFSRYADLVGPWKLGRIGLRYINRLPLPDGPCDLSDYLTVVNQSLSGPLARTLSDFYQRYHLEYEHPAGTLVHQTGMVREGEKESIMLDLHFISVGDVDDASVLVPWLDEAHDRLNEGFIASLNRDYYDRLKREVSR